MAKNLVPPRVKRFNLRTVQYVIADFLGRPVICEHTVATVVLEAEKNYRSVKKNTPSGAFNAAKCKGFGKRTCGQSQQSARQARKQKMMGRK